MRALKRVLGTSLMHERRQILNERVTFVDIIARFLAEVKRQEDENQMMIPVDEIKELRRKARNFDIIMGASKREIEAMWDAMNGTGCPAQPLIDALERRQR